MAQTVFTRQELESIQERAMSLATDQEEAGLRTALQLLGEAAGNLAAKLPSEDSSSADAAIGP